MNFEYQMLALMTLIFLLAFIPSSIGKLKSYGGRWLASNRTPLHGKELLPWAARCERAYSNLKDYFPAYAVTILLLGTTGKFDSATECASMLFVVGRVLHYIAYGMGNVPFRFLSYVLAMASNLFLLIKVFI